MPQVENPPRPGEVLLVVSPLGLLCWVLPQTQSWARLWSSTFFGAVFTQFVQVLALKLGGSLLTMKIPGLMRSHLGDGLGFARYLVYRQGARALEGRRGGAPRGGA